ncbi:MAG: DEAD/DEAH box helicase [Planctomycetes bacterium]|nr:DEAD/DEAH box helicase [Planctomycetota bacterium]
MTPQFQGGRRGAARGRGPRGGAATARPKSSEAIRPLDPTATPPEIDSFRHWEGLGEEIQAAIAEMGITSPTPIQRLAIGPVLAGKDVIAKAETGTGKTLAFGAPMMAKIDPQRASVLGLVLCPTRELAEQVQKVLAALGKPRGIEVALIVGGEPAEPQVRALKRGAQVVVGTPGRILDLYKQKFLSFPWTEFAVLDEADVMFEIGFIDDVKEILSLTPEERQTLLFSATFPPELLKLARENTRDPAEVATAAGVKTVDNIEQSVIFVSDEDRALALMRLIENSEPEDVFLVFCPRRTDVDKLIRRLERMPYSIKALHGGYDQAARFRVMGAFRTGEVKALIATDVASRGLDVAHVTTVVNYGSPQDITDYTHRIGRTGRAGRKGRAITLVGGLDARRWKQIEREATWTIPEVEPPLRAPRGGPRRAEAPAPRAGIRPPADDQRRAEQAPAGAERAAPRADRGERGERVAERHVRGERVAERRERTAEHSGRAAPRSERAERPSRSAEQPEREARGDQGERNVRRESPARPAASAPRSAARSSASGHEARAERGPDALRGPPAAPPRSAERRERSWPQDEHSPAAAAAPRGRDADRQLEPWPDDPVDRRDRPLRHRDEAPRWPVDHESPRSQSRERPAPTERPERRAAPTPRAAEPVRPPAPGRGRAAERTQLGERAPRGEREVRRPAPPPAAGRFPTLDPEIAPERDVRPRGPDAAHAPRRAAPRPPDREPRRRER